MSDIVINDDFGALTELLDNAELAPTVEDMHQCEMAVIERIRAEVAARSDGLRRAIVWHEKLAEDAKRVAKQAEARAAKIRAYVKSEMEAAGIKKIQTPTGSLAVRGNGGVEPLVVFDEDALPDDMKVVEVFMSLPKWNQILERMAESGDDDIAEKPVRVWPANTYIREALAKPCADCAGTGKTNAGNCPECESEEFSTSPYDFGMDQETGYRDSGVRAGCSKCGHDADIEDFMRKVNCSTCAGSGKAQVPGARLDPRGTSLVVK